MWFSCVWYLVESEEELWVGGEEIQVVPAASSTEAWVPLVGRTVILQHLHQKLHNYICRQRLQYRFAYSE